MKEKKPKKAKAPKSAKKEPVKIEKISARHDFTDAEKLELAKHLAGLTEQKTRTEEEKKSVVAEWATKIKSIQTSISGTSAKITSGFEMRDTDCEVHFDWKKSTKTYIRVTDRKEIETRPITDPERQQHLKLEAEAKAPKIVPIKPVEPGQPLVSVDEALANAEKESPSTEE